MVKHIHKGDKVDELKCGLTITHKNLPNRQFWQKPSANLELLSGQGDKNQDLFINPPRLYSPLTRPDPILSQSPPPSNLNGRNVPLWRNAHILPTDIDQLPTSQYLNHHPIKDSNSPTQTLNPSLTARKSYVMKFAR